jgi:replicative DNA helicase
VGIAGFLAMNENNITHMNLSRALLACALDFPAYLDAPEIARVQPADMHPSFADAWSKARELHNARNLSVTTLSAALPPSFSIPYLNSLRAEYEHTSFEDLRGIAGSLRQHAERRSLDELAADLAKMARGDSSADDVAREVIKRLTPIALSKGHNFTPLKDALSEVFDEIEQRSKNPTDVWGIPYKYYPRLSKITGGKHKGELTIFAGEPGVGKSWWAIQDAMGAAIDGTPTGMWCGEMKKKQIARRMLQLLGLDGRKSKTGNMDGQWDILAVGIETLENIPFFQDDRPLHIKDLRPVLTRLKNEHGVEYVVLDYAYLIGANGRDEIERTAMVSGECKNVLIDLDLAGTLITSVNKMGMDTTANAAKSNVRGSGQQIHDADNVFMLTKFSPVDDMDKLRAKLDEYDQFATLHITKGRELDAHIPGGCIHYRRQNSPKFEEQP